MEFDFLTPIETNLLIELKNLSSQHLSSKIVFHTQTDFHLDKVNIAIIGVTENRGNQNHLPEVELTKVRQNLYNLFPGNWSLTIADLGDILKGDSPDDTYFALQKIITTLIKRKIIPIIIGGSRTLTYAMYRAYDNLEQMVNLVSIDSKFDLGKDDNVLSNSYLSKMIVNEPNNLFNYSNIGYQTYYNSQEEIKYYRKTIL